VITVVQYARNSTPSNPTTDAAGRFAKTANILGYT